MRSTTSSATSQIACRRTLCALRAASKCADCAIGPAPRTPMPSVAESAMVRSMALGCREPLFEAGAGELCGRAGQRGALRIGRGVRAVGLRERSATGLADLERVTSAGEERRCRIGETLLPRARDLGAPAVLDLRLLGRVGERLGHDAGG